MNRVLSFFFFLLTQDKKKKNGTGKKIFLRTRKSLPVREGSVQYSFMLLRLDIFTKMDKKKEYIDCSEKRN